MGGGGSEGRGDDAMSWGGRREFRGNGLRRTTSFPSQSRLAVGCLFGLWISLFTYYIHEDCSGAIYISRRRNCGLGGRGGGAGWRMGQMSGPSLSPEHPHTFEWGGRGGLCFRIPRRYYHSQSLRLQAIPMFTVETAQGCCCCGRIIHKPKKKSMLRN